MKKSEMWSEFIFLVLIIFKAEASILGDEPPQTMLVNNMVVPAVREEVTAMLVDFTAFYFYVDGDIVNVACVNLVTEALLTMEYLMAGRMSDNSIVKDISSRTMIGFTAKLHAGHNNSHMICTHTGTTDYTKVLIVFRMQPKPNISISINGMILRPSVNPQDKSYYIIKYKLASHQPMNVTCEVEQTDVILNMIDDHMRNEDSKLPVSTKTVKIPNKKIEHIFQLNSGEIKTFWCLAEFVTGGLAERVHFEFSTANLPMDSYSSMHMELPPSGSFMELYSYKKHILFVILYEAQDDEIVHLTCGPLSRHPQISNVLYLQLKDTGECRTIGCFITTTLKVIPKYEQPPVVCYLINDQDPRPGIVWKEIRVILLDRALAVTEPSSTTLSTTLTADIFTNNPEAEPPSSNTNTLVIALGSAIVIIILLVLVLVKKQWCIRLSSPIPAPRPDPASVFYLNLLSVCRPINEREPAALPENHYEELPHGDLTNENCNTNKGDQYDECHNDDHLPNGEARHETPVSAENKGLGEPEYAEIDYSRGKPKVTEAPLRTSYDYDEPYQH